MDEEKKEENQLEGNNQPAGNFLVPGAIIVAGALIAGAVIYSNPNSRPSPGGVNAPIPSNTGGSHVSGNLADDDPFLGNPGAPVTIVEFGDFQCPFCGRFFQSVEPQIIDRYVKTGKVKFVYRDFAFLGQESEWAAEAAECAKEQGKFWEYHNYLFSHQQGENQGAFTKDHLKEFAQTLNLDLGKFNSCLDPDKYLGEVRKDTEDGRNAGVNGTPANFVNGQIIQGAVPFDQFKKVIDEELAKTK